MNPNNNDADTTPSTNPAVPANDVPTNDVSASDTPATESSATTPPEFQDTASNDQVAATPSPIPAQAPATSTTPFFAQTNEVPVATPTPEAPVTPPAGVSPQVPNGSDKKALKRVALVIGAVLLVAVGVLVYFMLTTVSKEDYAKASSQFDKVALANSELGSDIASMGYRTDDELSDRFDESVKEADASIEKLKTENEALSKLKAVTVGEGATLYKTFNEKLDKFTAYSKDMLTSAKSLRPALVVCGKVSDATDDASRVAALKECSAAYGNVKDVPLAEFKTLADTMKAGYAEYATKFEQISALTNPAGAQYEEYKTLRDEMYDIQDRISAATKKFSEDLKKHEADLSVKESAEALETFLEEKEA